MQFKVFTQQDELLNEEEEIYRRRNNSEKSCISFGQRKLLLMLISFLTKYLDKTIVNPVIIYAGSAPGFNIGIVSKLFPDVIWHLYDPASFKLKRNDKIQLYQEYFTDQIAEGWAEIQQKDKNIYFISDIRTADYTKAKDLDDNERQIMEDMNMQRKWVEIIKPNVSHLKFRLPYSLANIPDEVEYLDGIIYKTPYAPQTSTETRLVVLDHDIHNKYSCKQYQSQLFYHNNIIREKYKYINEYQDIPEILDDYDSCLEMFLWKEYLLYINKTVTKENVIKLSRDATKLLTQGRKYNDTLAYLRSNPRAIKERNFNGHK